MSDFKKVQNIIKTLISTFLALFELVADLTEALFTEVIEAVFPRKVPTDAPRITTETVSEMGTPMVIPPAQIYRKVLSIQVPSNTPWDAEQAKRFMVALFAVGCPLNLVIRASEYEIAWSIEAGDNFRAPIVSAIQSTYPKASIQIAPKEKLDVGFYRFILDMHRTSIAPIEDVSNLKVSDPLAVFVAGMINLQSGEELVYELILNNPKQDYRALGEQFLTKPENKMTDFLSDQARDLLNAKKAYEPNREQRFEGSVDTAFRAKTNAQLKDARFFIKIKANSYQRATTIANELYPALSIFDGASLNYLIWSTDTSYPLVLTAGEAAGLWHVPSQDIKASGVKWLSGVVTPLPHQLSLLAKSSDKNTITLGTNIFQDKTQEVKLKYYNRVTHVNLIGQTQVGKSTLLHHMIHQDIQNGKGVGIIDPHGKLVNDVLACSIPSHRAQDVILLDVSDKAFPIGLNLMSPESGVDIETHAAFVVAVFRKIFEDNWSSGRMEDVIYASVISLLYHPGSTLLDIPSLLLNPQFRAMVVKKVKDPVARGFWRDEFEPRSDAVKLQIAQPVNTRLRRLFRDPHLRRILCQPRSLDFRSMINQNKIVLANLGGMAKRESETMGSLLMAKIQMAAMSRGENPPSTFYFYVDEVQNFITTSLSEILSEAAKFGLSMVIANQYLKQLQGDTLDAVLGNVGTTVIFRVGESDAKALAGTVRPSATPDDLMNLDRFQTVVKMQLDRQTLPAFSMMTLPPLPPKDDADATTRNIRDNTRQNFGKPSDEIDEEINKRYGDDESTDDDDSDGEDDEKGGFLG